MKDRQVPEESFAGQAVTVMGLGLHGGGAAAARFFAGEGARVTVTDLRSESELADSIESLEGLPVRYVLGRHDEADFREADIVVKNPAVRRNSPYLALARRIETDVSVFLARNPARLAVVTGTKGKSSTTAAIHHVLSRAGETAYLGGNITRSPLDFLPDLAEAEHGATVVLELSSFQLGDLALTPAGIGALTPEVAVITGIYRDHLDYYGTMEDYIADKRLVYAGQGPRDWTIARDDETGLSFLAETPSRPAVLHDDPPEALGTVRSEADATPTGAAHAYLDGKHGIARIAHVEEEIVPVEVSLRGFHMRRNLLAAGLAARLLGISAPQVREATASFGGIAHRLEPVGEHRGIRFYNDSAATIPEAALAAVKSFEEPVHLIAGGSTKNVDFAPFAEITRRVTALYLLEGSAQEAVLDAVEKGASEMPLYGPFHSLETAVAEAVSRARAGEAVVLSPGCASFGMFRNEFHRGDRFRDIVRGLS
ncbi:MAG: UDP-N-acetylmuramoyl-L-alanine--D-glutamate ligase [Spirochaetaceae bacterium]